MLPAMQTLKFPLLAALWLLAGSPGRAAQATATAIRVTQSSAKAEAARFAAVPEAMQRFVDDQSIAGAVTLVARHDRVLALNAVGFADLATRAPMRTDALFWIASMTKPMTAVAVLMLQDEGKLSVEDPVEKYLPEFKGQWSIAESSNDRRVVKSQKV